MIFANSAFAAGLRDAPQRVCKTFATVGVLSVPGERRIGRISRKRERQEGGEERATFSRKTRSPQCFDPLSWALSYVQPTSDGLFRQAPNSRDRGDQFSIKVDHDLSKNQKLSAYYYFDDDNTLDPFAKFQAAGGNLGNFPGDFATRTQQINVSHTWTLGSTAVNEARFSYFREGQGKFNTPTVTSLVQNSCGSAPAAICFTGTTDTPLIDGSGAPITPDPNFGIHPNLGAGKEGLPFISVDGGLILGNNFEGQLPQVGNTFQWSDNFSKIIGNHSLKFGGDIRNQKFDQTLYYNVNGSYTFGGSGANDVAADDNYPNYLLGLPNTYTQGSAQQEKVRSKSVYLFAQDSWKIRSNLTLNYGVRWEVNTPLNDTGTRCRPSGRARIRQFIRARLRRMIRCSRPLGPGACDAAGETPRGACVSRGQGCSALVNENLLEGLCSATRSELESWRARWLAWQVNWRPGQDQHQRGTWNVL